LGKRPAQLILSRRFTTPDITTITATGGITVTGGNTVTAGGATVTATAAGGKRTTDVRWNECEAIALNKSNLENGSRAFLAPIEAVHLASQPLFFYLAARK